ncbi:MAG: ribosome rescue protein RqcH [Thermoproteus sp. AZ2]|uniref:Ribosome rescue protein RqcH n=1 Tax=Thermoproteus sp. AZ2 TaxID=1609232 RepID=A0ACC6V0T9_9CREN|nr:MAG: RNA-binding protein [Thermoproteus sp. AZ2]
MKTSLTVIDLYASAREIGGLIGRRVENIYAAPSGYLLKFAGGFYVVINESRASITGVVGQKTYKGAETLRGLIRDSRLTAVEVPRFDKILLLRFEDVELITELLRPFNLIAVRGGKVVWVDRYYRGKDREVKPGAPYAPPPMPYVDPLARPSEALERLKAAQDVKRALIRELGLGPEVAEEVYARGGGDAEASLKALHGLVKEVREGELSPTIYLAGGGPITTTPVEYISVRYEAKERVEAFWKALDKYFAELEIRRALEQQTEEVEAERARLAQSLEKLRKEAEEYKKRAEELRARAKALLDAKYEVEETLERLEGRGRIRILNVDKRARKVFVECCGAQYELSYAEPLGRQIEAMFEEAKELLRKAQRAEEAAARLSQELERLEAERRAAEESIRASIRRAAERSWFEKFRWTLTSRRTPALGGRDASQNEALVKRYLKEDYLFIHADIPGASAVVAKPAADELELLELAQFAASYSRAWKAGIHALDVFWVPGRQVSKKPPSGEYLAKGSFMVYGSKNWVRHVRLEIAVGYRSDGDVVRIVAASPKSIALLAEKYAVLTPGSGEKSRTAKELGKRWGLPQYSLDELMGALPGPAEVEEYGEGAPIPWEEVESAFAEW